MKGSVCEREIVCVREREKGCVCERVREIVCERGCSKGKYIRIYYEMRFKTFHNPNLQVLQN